MIEDFSTIERRLASYANYETIPGFGFADAAYDLSHVRELLRRLGDPHLGPVTIHVAGSKGKGSISALTAGGLGACGLKTGLYTSPHLVHLGERIQVDGECITPTELSEMLDLALPHLEAMQSEGQWRRFTYFEVVTTLAFLYFRARGVEAQVIEVGLGGRLDATNVVRPHVCVIAPISLEHTAVLGNTIEAIAGEKTGIIKPGAVVVSAPQDPGAMRVIAAACSRSGARLVRVGADVTFQVEELSLSGQLLKVRTASGQREYRTSLCGSFQAENAATAVAALEALTDGGLKLEHACVTQGFAETRWPGRFQILALHPLLVLDGAHNPASMRRLAESMARLGIVNDVVFVIGFSSDKDVRGTIRELLPLGGRIILTRSSQSRALSPCEIAQRVSDLGLPLCCEEDPLEALGWARKMAGAAGSVCVAGSLFLVADILRWWQSDATAASDWPAKRT